MYFWLNYCDKNHIGEDVKTIFIITISKYRFFVKTKSNETKLRVIEQKKKQVIFANMVYSSYLFELVVFHFAQGDLRILQHLSWRSFLK